MDPGRLLARAYDINPVIVRAAAHHVFYASPLIPVGAVPQPFYVIDLPERLRAAPPFAGAAGTAVLPGPQEIPQLEMQKLRRAGVYPRHTVVVRTQQTDGAVAHHIQQVLIHS